MKTKILLIMVILLVLPLVTSEAAYVFNKNQDINFSLHAFKSDNSKADETTSCYLTVKDPNLKVIVDDEEMGFNIGGYYNYTIASSLIEKLGEYPTTMRCDDTFDFAFSSFSFFVGDYYTEAQGNLISTILLIVFAFSVFFLVFSKFTDKGGLQLFFIVMSFIFLISSLMLSIVSIENMLTSSKILQSTSYLLYAIGLIFFVFMMTIMIKITVVALNALKESRGL